MTCFVWAVYVLACVMCSPIAGFINFNLSSHPVNTNISHVQLGNALLLKYLRSSQFQIYIALMKRNHQVIFFPLEQNIPLIIINITAVIRDPYCS